MIYYENECCGCATGSYPCLGSRCPQRHVLHVKCDKCHAEVEELYYGADGEQLCANCALEESEKDSPDIALVPA